MAFSLERRVGRPGRSSSRPLRDARHVGRAAIRSVPAPAITASFKDAGSRSSAGPAKRFRSRPARSPSLITGWRNHSRPPSCAGRTTFIVVRLEPGADVAAVQREIRRRLPYNDVYRQAEWAARSRGYWIESTGLGLTLFLTVTLGALVGVVIVAPDALRLDDRAPGRVWHGEGIGRRQSDSLCDRRRAGVVRGGPGLRSGPGPGVRAGARCSRRFDMKMIVSPTLAALVFVGTQALCVGAASLSFRKVASLDPAIVFRG